MGFGLEAEKVAKQLRDFLDSVMGKTALSILKEEHEMIVFTSPVYQPCAYIDGDGVWAMALDFKERRRITFRELVILSVESNFVSAEDLLDWFLMSLGLVAQKHLAKKHFVKIPLPH